MSDSPVDYSIVVPAYNEEDFLAPTLASIRAAMAQADAWRGELIVVDNDSTDRTAEVARESGARVVHEAHRQIARARNTGAGAGSGRYLIFVDADTQLPPDLLDTTLYILEHTPVCYGGTRVAFDRQPSPAIARTLALWNRLSRLMTWAAGSYLFCRRDAFEAVGGFDERVYASEEIGLCRRLKRYARRHQLRGTILGLPVITSIRKADWFTTWRMVRMLFRLAIWPRGLRSRKSCWLWYERPAEGEDNSSS